MGYNRDQYRTVGLQVRLGNILVCTVYCANVNPKKKPNKALLEMAQQIATALNEQEGK